MQPASSASSRVQILVGSPQERAKWARDHKLMEKLRHENIDIDLLFGDPASLPKPTWREQVLEILHSSVGQIVLALLIVLDSLLIVSEIIIDVKYLTAESACLQTEIAWLENYMVGKDVELRETWSAARANRGNMQHLIEFLQMSLRGNDSAVRPLSTSVYRRRPRVAADLTAVDVDDYRPDNRSKSTASVDATLALHLLDLETTLLQRENEMIILETAKSLVHTSSVIILFVFILEVTSKVICMRTKFFTSKLELLDGAIIWASFLVDVITLIGHTEAPEASVMIILLIWRIVRLVNGFLIQEKQRTEAQTEILQQVHHLTVQEVTYLREAHGLRGQFVERLKCACRKRGMSDAELDALEPVLAFKDAEPQDSGDKRNKKTSSCLDVFSRSALNISRSIAHSPSPSIDQRARTADEIDAFMATENGNGNETRNDQVADAQCHIACAV